MNGQWIDELNIKILELQIINQESSARRPIRYPIAGFDLAQEWKNGLAVISKFSSAARKCLQREKNAFFKKYAFLNKQLWFSSCRNAP